MLPKSPATSSALNRDDLTWRPYREPLRATLTRTVVIALVVGAVLAPGMGGPRQWPLATLLVLWFSFGGHWVELWFLNSLRPRLAARRVVQVGVRIAVWFVAGTLLALGMRLTAMSMASPKPTHWPAWWVGGLAFIGVELAAHLVLQLRGRPSFYSGRG